MSFDFLEDLNPAQREAVLHTDGPLLILAGAGSGKTRVIAYRIAYLVASGLADSSEVLAVTFTNKAAEQMRQRVESLLGAAYGSLWISTFHSLCARLLRREAAHIGLSRDFVIYDSADQLSAVKRVLRDLQIEESLIQPRQALAAISQAKNRMESPATMAARRSTYRDDQIGRVYLEYTKALTASGALDFDDLLVRTVELFDKAETVRHQYSRRFRFVMVDEYQDTNRPQYLLMRRLAE
ncbi:MAG: UvrD-helicase domain-containing protein, partial [Acidobacteriota bacterium]